MSRRKSKGPIFGKPRKRSKAVTALAWLSVSPFVLVFAMAMVGDRFWITDMVANFVWPIALLSVFPLIISAACRRAVPAMLVVLLAASFTVRSTAVARADRGTEADARVMIFNAYAEGRSNEKTLAMLRETDADLVLLNECDFPLAQSILADAALVARYPHHELPEHENQWARGVLCVWPLTRLEERDETWQENRFEYLYRRAQIVQHPTTPFVTGIVHFDSPRSSERWKNGNERMRKDIALVTGYLAPQGLPMVIGADLNTPPPGSRSRIFCRELGLRRAKPFVAMAGTWPQSAPAMFRTPIDDLMMSESVRVVSWETIKTETDSDHVPVLVTIDLPDATQAPTSQAP